MHIHETWGPPIMEPCVVFPHPRYIEVYIWIGTTHVALVYTHSEATLCRTINHRWSLAIALPVPFLKTFKLCFIH